MKNFKESLAAVLVISLAVFLAQGLTLGVASLFPSQEAPQSLGSSSDNVLPALPTATRVFVNSTDTTVVASSSARVALELFNASGATTTAQTVFCNYGDRPATLYSGFSLSATTTKVYLLDNLYRGAIHCIAPANGALITVTDF
jgi:hypothetical protein